MRLLLSVLFVGLMAVATATQGTSTGTVVEGVVLDDSGAIVPGAVVMLKADARLIQSTTADAKGAFRFATVAPGTYEVTASMPGVGISSAAVTVAGRAVSLRLVLHQAAARDAARVPAGNLMESRPMGMSSASTAAATAPPPPAPMPTATFGVVGQAPDREAYARIEEGGFHHVADRPLSTFSIDVDTASYANVRRFLTSGTLPPADAVRVEELVNYFRFDYAAPRNDRPFAVTTEVGPAPWAPGHRLVLVGLKARAIERRTTPPRNLVFLIDVSGSMASADKLPMVQSAMRMLAATLTSSDRVAIVVYAGAGGVVLPSTNGADRSRIQSAIGGLGAGGSTNGASGIRLAYDIASQAYIEGGVNRVILATDGDFNVGVTSQSELTRLIERERGRGVFLSVLGVGTGNLQDATMEMLADKGNGNYSYLDSIHEARRVLIAEAGSTLVTVAKDVKIQVEFNPAHVGAYRLVGYENRILGHRDFNDDTKDAGEMGAGHTVTALYEIVAPGDTAGLSGVDPLKYQRTRPAVAAEDSGELLTVKLRYKEPDGEVSRAIAVPVRDRAGALTANVGFAAAVAQFGMLLRHSPHTGDASWEATRALADRYRGEDPDGYRAEFVRLVELAAALEAQRVHDDDVPRRQERWDFPPRRVPVSGH